MYLDHLSEVQEGTVQTLEEAGVKEAVIEVQRLIGEVTANHEPHIVDVRIAVLFRDELKNKGGKRVCGSVSRVSGLLQFFANRYYQQRVDVLLEIDYLLWQKYTDVQKKALVHHELRHIRTEWDDEKQDYKRDKEGNIKFNLVAHDKEEFTMIEELYGSDWNDIEDDKEKKE